MATVFDVQPTELIEKVAQKLKEIPEIQPTEWADFVKTGVHKERPPENGDWWYIRAAAILRSVYLLGPIGVSKLRTKYGGKKNRGVKPERFYKGSGNIIRTILQQLEAAELIKQGEIGVHKGRLVTPKGKSLLDKTATEVRGPLGKKKVVEKKEIEEDASQEIEDAAEETAQEVEDQE